MNRLARAALTALTAVRCALLRAPVRGRKLDCAGTRSFTPERALARDKAIGRECFISARLARLFANRPQAPASVLTRSAPF